MIDDVRLLGPVLATSVRALPYAFRNVAATHEAYGRLSISGAAGGACSVVRQFEDRLLGVDVGSTADATVPFDQDTA